MDGGRLRCLITFFTCNTLLLLVIFLHDAEATKWKQQSGKVDETVVLSSDLPPEGVSSAYWKYDNFTIADKDDLVSEQHPFLGRVDLNPTDYSLTITKLTVHDSGNFTFVSLVNDEQRESVCITLQVQEPKSPTFIIILGVAGGSCLIIVIITGIIAVVCHRKHKRAVMGTESVYADISDVNVNGTSSTMTPCSVYETIDNRVSRDHKDMPAPQTVYDKIQLNRVTPGVS
ncbi:uncharacterized protein LOC115438252 isoform X2 [Sphaeramia orbicularis]|uniref:uncharacterized protein LOC115438252 isoform X2 n=1 Tax=Sphaeramia orbicularis TaxID=375764 RepID=UPI0011810918|nr:uncharacterized protein LOC115438252 isoform X2 [Sphaeramia orbicularis]